MKKITAQFLFFCILFSVLSLTGCRFPKTDAVENLPEPTVIELDMKNCRKCLRMTCKSNSISAGDKDSIL